jgi:hypothetical protein
MDPDQTCTVVIPIDCWTLMEEPYETVYTQDGVTTFIFLAIQAGDDGQYTYTLTLEPLFITTRLQRSMMREQQWWLQDGQSRMTI